MSAGDCICAGEKLTFEELTVSCVFSLVDLTVSPLTWDILLAFIQNLYFHVLTFHGLPSQSQDVVNNKLMPEL